MTVKFLSFVHPGKTISARFTSTKMTMIDRNGFKSLTNTDSVTRFGKISLLWQYCKGLGQYREGLLGVWLNFEPIWQYLTVLGKVLLL